MPRERRSTDAEPAALDDAPWYAIQELHPYFGFVLDRSRERDRAKFEGLLARADLALLLVQLRLALALAVDAGLAPIPLLGQATQLLLDAVEVAIELLEPFQEAQGLADVEA